MMTTKHILIRNNHCLFACEVINGLNRFYGIPIKLLQHSDDDRFFNNDIRWGIVTISYVFRTDFFKIFSLLEKGLKNGKKFQKYCMLISVSRNDRYFFNFLRRVSLIYEMTVYCYKNGKDYFKRAQNCIAQYQDKEYFEFVGSWSNLNKTASFIRELGNPFLLVILEESTSQHPLRFSVTVERIERRLREQNNRVILNSKEMNFLMEQKEKFISREKDERSVDLHVEKENAFLQCLKSTSCMSNIDAEDQVSMINERRAIIKYLGNLLLTKITNKENSDESNEEENKSIASKLTKIESLIPGLMSIDESSLLQIVNTLNEEDFSLLENMLYSDNEPAISGSPPLNKEINVSSSENNSSELSKDVLHSQCPPEEGNVQQCSSENECLEHINDSDLPCKSYSHTESNISEFNNSSNYEEDYYKLLENDLYNEATLFNESFYSPENVSPKQSILTNDNPAVVEHALHSSIVVDSDSMSAPLDETAQTTFNESLKQELNTEVKVSSDKSDSNSNRNVENSRSQNQQRRGRKNKRKKKGKRK